MAKDKGHQSISGTVQVVEGDVANLTGKITSIEGSKMRMKPINANLGAMFLEFQADELVKHFSLGDYVQVVSGRFEDASGVIVKVDQSEALLLAGLTQYELRVFPKNLQVSEEVATGVDHTGQYQFGDLVQLDVQTVGVIVRQSKETFQILNMHGNLVHFKAASILKKLNSTRAVSLDSGLHPIRVKDRVIVVDGGREGEIKHLYRGRAFLHSDMVPNNEGFFVCKTQNLLLKGATKKKPLSSVAINSGFMLPRMVSSMTHRPSVGGTRGDSELRGKRVKITEGYYKGYIGIVKDVRAATARVELSSSCQTITVEKTHLTRVADAGTSITRQTGAPSPTYSAFR